MKKLTLFVLLALSFSGNAKILSPDYDTQGDKARYENRFEKTGIDSLLDLIIDHETGCEYFLNYHGGVQIVLNKLGEPNCPVSNRWERPSSRVENTGRPGYTIPK